ncbi:hypothetical protein, partial [Achromobacter ruhlandii]|uniref:hypothetical protein n=1 Tax=Achromobacter ruhlandii TaxID=72557 RepID=UPI003BA17168
FVCDGLVQVQAVVVGLENFFLHVDCSLEMKFALQMRGSWEAARSISSGATLTTSGTRTTRRRRDPIKLCLMGVAPPA